MKKTILILVVLALAVPSAALAATEFSLGGFIKLDSFWDSTQEGKNMNTAIGRDNNPDFQHGRLKFTAQGSRFNFTIKGPKLWGATTTGFIEMDFDAAETGALAPGTAAPVASTLGVGSTSSQAYTPRLRHAMFRLNWPETEMLMGLYWSMLCEWWPEVAQDGPFMGTGIPTARLGQIRLTQTFAGAWTVAGLIGEPNAISGGGNVIATNNPYSAAGVSNSGETSETPQVQGKIMFQQDLWGKAAYYGKPTPFTAQVVAGWQRNVIRSGLIGGTPITLGQNGYTAVGSVLGTGPYVNQTYVSPWMLNGVLFIPVIPTTSANVAGTASILANYFVGQGLEAFGMVANGSNLWKYDSNWAGVNAYDFDLLRRWGGYVQGQYYFTNQWFLNLAYSMSKAFGVSQSQASWNAGTTGGREVAFNADTWKAWYEMNLTLWYRPIQAVKFGLQYSYGRTDWFQARNSTNTNVAAGVGLPATASTNIKDFGEAHRVEFVGFFYF